MRSIGHLIVGALALALSGCAGNAYTEFYEPISYSGSLATPQHFSGQPQVSASSGDLLQDDLRMYEDSYGAIGVVAISGPAQSIDDALQQAVLVGASHVIIAREYESTYQGSYTMRTPTTTTTNFGGMAGSTPYTGTATTYGTQTTNIPYSVTRYSQVAYFYAPLSREGLGAYCDEVPSELKAETGTNSGVFVKAIRKGSPAYEADLVPGDVILTVAEKPITISSFHETIRGVLDRPAEFVIWRRGERLTKRITVPASW